MFEQKEDIQGMAKVMYGYICGNDECGKCKEPNCNAYRNAVRLYNACYGDIGKAICTYFGEMLNELLKSKYGYDPNYNLAAETLLQKNVEVQHSGLKELLSRDEKIHD